MSSAERIVVTGIGMICPLGDDAHAVFDRIVAGEHSTREWPDLGADGFPVTVAHRVTDEMVGADPLRRGRDLAVRAATSALGDAALSPDDAAMAGLYVGSTMGESAIFEAAATGTDGLDLDGGSAATFARHLAGELAIGGPQRSYGTACAAGNYAIGAAANAIRRGRIDRAIAGGVDPFSRIAMLGFARVRAMSNERCRPFDAERRGMQLSEGAAFLVLERESAARRRGARVHGAIGALGLSGDAHHPTAPRPDGAGPANAMAAALRSQSLNCRDIGWVNAHGTGTPASDGAEAAAIATAFGTRRMPVSSLKGAFGHCMGAATAIEAAMTVVALQRRLLPPTVGVRTVDPALGIDVVREPRPAPQLHWALNCGYAFGGLNSALLIGAA